MPLTTLLTNLRACWATQKLKNRSRLPPQFRNWLNPNNGVSLSLSSTNHSRLPPTPSQSNAQASASVPACTVHAHALPTPLPLSTPTSSSISVGQPLPEIPLSWFSRRRSSPSKLSVETLKLDSENCKIELETGGPEEPRNNFSHGYPVSSTAVNSEGIEMELCEMFPARAYVPPSLSSVYDEDQELELRNMVLSPVLCLGISFPGIAIAATSSMYSQDQDSFEREDAKTADGESTTEKDEGEYIPEVITDTGTSSDVSTHPPVAVREPSPSPFPSRVSRLTRLEPGFLTLISPKLRQ